MVIKTMGITHRITGNRTKNEVLETICTVNAVGTGSCLIGLP